MAVKNIMIVGVGGQGTLLTSRILGGLQVDMTSNFRKYTVWHREAEVL